MQAFVLPGFFIDDHLTITPLHDTGGVRLRLEGEPRLAHHEPLTEAVNACMRAADEVTIDCRRLASLSDGILHTFVALAGGLRPPQTLYLKAAPELALAERCASQGWDQIPTLRLVLICA
ncbi:hypothetical protein [Streptomyces sp. SGAir0957]